MDRPQHAEVGSRDPDGKRRRGSSQTDQDPPDLSFGLDEPGEALLGRFLAELRRFGARINLVGRTDKLAPHVRDSLAAVPRLPGGARVLDLGSGAGFPGIPITIARPDLRVVLMEIRERRVHFLRHVVRTLGLECEVWRRSAEDPPRGEDRPFDVVLVRAVAPPPRALPLAAPWVRPGGEIWLWTRAKRLPSGFEEAGSVPLGDRGRIAQLPMAGVPRGTS